MVEYALKRRRLQKHIAFAQISPVIISFHCVNKFSFTLSLRVYRCAPCHPFSWSLCVPRAHKSFYKSSSPCESSNTNVFSVRERAHGKRLLNFVSIYSLYRAIPELDQSWREVDQSWKDLRKKRGEFDSPWENFGIFAFQTTENRFHSLEA